MPTISTLAMVVSALALVVTVGTHVWNGSWGLSGKLSKMETGLRQALAAAERSIEDRSASHLRDVSNSMLETKNKIQEVELYIRDNYVRQTDFQQFASSFREDVMARLARIERLLDARMP